MIWRQHCAKLLSLDVMIAWEKEEDKQPFDALCRTDSLQKGMPAWITGESVRAASVSAEKVGKKSCLSLKEMRDIAIMGNKDQDCYRLGD